VEEHAIVGRPEQGYAMGHDYPGAGADTVVGDGAVIRAGAVIYAGTEIGEYALVGAGSVVTRDIPAGAVAFGVPARVRGTTDKTAE
jgi:acetyltransferase-like isoleucine patch superfamily enzyme